MHLGFDMIYDFDNATTAWNARNDCTQHEEAQLLQLSSNSRVVKLLDSRPDLDSNI